MLNKLYILIDAVCGLILCYLVRFRILRPTTGLNTKEERPQPLIVSLTSYGRRVDSVVYATIVSLLRQSYAPDMLVLWLDDDHWNGSNIPTRLKELTKQGLTIRYCKDLKSYKKIVPALQDYPDALIITCDDDLYYKSNMVERLVEAHKQHPSCIIAHRAHKMIRKDGRLAPYNDWPEEISDQQGNDVFPTSGGGTLYSSKLLHDDVTKEELFSTLAPKADDVWLFFMGYLKGTPNIVLKKRGYLYYQMDVFYQTLHSNSNLKSQNLDEGLNDKQIRNIIEHYNIQGML